MCTLLHSVRSTLSFLLQFVLQRQAPISNEVWYRYQCDAERFARLVTDSSDKLKELVEKVSKLHLPALGPSSLSLPRNKQFSLEARAASLLKRDVSEALQASQFAISAFFVFLSCVNREFTRRVVFQHLSMTFQLCCFRLLRTFTRLSCTRFWSTLRKYRRGFLLISTSVDFCCPARPTLVKLILF